jgi:Tol biopolymer transport system component
VARHSVRLFAGVLTVVALALVGCDASTTGQAVASATPAPAPATSASASPTPSATPSDSSNGLIAYSRFTGPSLATAALEASRLDGTGQVSLTRAQTGVKDQDPAWSHDGTLVAFDRETPKTGCGTGCFTREIFVVDVSSRAVKQLTTSPSGAACGTGATVNSCHYDPAFSPDGTKIAYAGTVGTASNAPTAIWVANADGSDAHQVTKPPTAAVDSGPSWSPDSASIVFNRVTGQNATIVTIHADGTDLNQLTPASGHFGDHPAWSPDGSKILFRSNFNASNTTFEQSDLFTVTPSGTSLAPLTQTAATFEYLAGAWSPDGSRIIVGRVQKGVHNDQSQLVTMNSDGSRIRVVLIDPNWQSDPAWDPTSSKS